MTNPEVLRRRIAVEEAQLARIDNERAETLARLEKLKCQLATADRVPTPPKPAPSTRAACRPEKSFSSGWLSLSERIRAASEIPIEVDLLEKTPFPKGGKEPRGK
jgi:hypothetical protein